MPKNKLQENKQVTFTQPIRTLRDLMKATIKDDATMANGGYDLFSEEIKKYIIRKDGSLMTWEDWYKKPHPLISPHGTEDADFEIINPKQIENKNNEEGI